MWKTSTYQQQFPTYKPGIGLMAKFGQPVKLAQVAINSPSPGTVVEIHTVGLRQTRRTCPPRRRSAPATLVDGQTIINVTQAQPSQYILVWITQLAPTDSGSFQSSIGEITYTQAQ